MAVLVARRTLSYRVIRASRFHSMLQAEVTVSWTIRWISQHREPSQSDRCCSRMSRGWSQTDPYDPWMNPYFASSPNSRSVSRLYENRSHLGPSAPLPHWNPMPAGAESPALSPKPPRRVGMCHPMRKRVCQQSLSFSMPRELRKPSPPRTLSRTWNCRPGRFFRLL